MTSKTKTPEFVKTAKQYEAVDLLTSEARHVMLYGGSRSGKTFILIYLMVVRALKTKSRHLILRLHFNHVKTSVWHDTLPNVLSTCWPELPVVWNRSDYFITFPNGSEIWIGGLDDKDRTEKVLGTEYSTIFFNESSQFTYKSITTALSRLAEKTKLINRAYYDCNPPHKQHWAYRIFIENVQPKSRLPLPKPERYAAMLMNPVDNLENLPKDYLDVLEELPRRQRERFLLGLWLDSSEGALWKYDDILRESNPPDMERIVVAIDPAVTASKKSDETGIVVAGICGNRFYVLEDVSGRYTPKEWANVAVNAYFRHHADRIIGEVNNGGDMIETTLRQVNASVSYKSVTATRGKVVRAEPIAALYEQHRGYHVGSFPELEDQMVTPFEDIEGSPDRIDACLAEGTLILTRYGETPIEDVAPGDLVWTRGGWKPVVAMRCAHNGAEVMSLYLSNGRRITGTHDHRVWVDGKGWTPLNAVVCGDIIETWNQQGKSDTALSLQGRNSGSRNIGQSPRRVHASVVRSCENSRRSDVYDIMVEDRHEFIASGCLVHNCVWAATELMLKPQVSTEVYSVEM